MKYLIIIFVSLGISVQAQSTVEAFISKASEIKLQQRAITRQEVADFEQTVLELQEELNVKLDFLYAEAELGSEKQEALAVNSNQENLVSKEDQQKYMQLALQKMENEKKQNQKNNTNTISNNTTRMELMNKQKALSDKIRADQLRIEKRYTDFENDTMERKILFDNISKWEADLTKLIGIEFGQAQEAERLSQNIKEAQIKPCDENTKVYQDILIQHFSMLKSSI
jgi:hypothetical protein